MENFQTIGLRLDIIIIFWVVIALLAFTLTAFILDKFMGDWTMGVVVMAVFTGIALLIGTIMMIPFDAKYHHLYRVTGEVTSVSNVLSESGGDLTRIPVITLDTVDRDITIDDPRAVNLKGKNVELSCSIAWNYQAADQYNCQIYSIK